MPAPLQIGPVRLATNLLLAPVAGYCDLAFRTICREQGGVGLACTDLLSPQGLLRGTAASLDLAQSTDFDKPVGMQLYGSEPAVMAEGARWAVEHGATVIDINMGCPVDKVTKKDGGSKLLTDLPRTMQIVKAVVRALERCQGKTEVTSPAAPSTPGHLDTLTPSSVSVPLTAKMRLCWHDADYDAGVACSPTLARALADEGVAAVTVHGRTTEQKFAGTVRLDGIARVVEAVAGRIPVIGNGDVRTPQDAQQMMRQTGCDGVMIGRGAFSTPWLFRDTWSYLTTGVIPPAPTEEHKVAIIRRYFELMRQYRDDHYALHQVRRRISWFGKTLNHGACKPLKELIRLAPDPAAVHAALDRYRAGELRSMSEAEPIEV